MKAVVFLAVLFGLLFYNFVESHKGYGLRIELDAVLRRYWWLALLASFELLRQAHYLTAEIWGGYNEFATKKLGRAWAKATRDVDSWTKFRVARFCKWIVGLGILGLFLGGLTNKAPLRALLDLPAQIWAALPLVIQVLFYVMLGVSQFVAIFWFLSKGGVEVYNPGDIKTRFGDVWGQDHVVSKVRENIIFLQRPEQIEERGGYVPGGILLWGPPGTGKTLMAEAVAGETGKPYVFVDPGAFINMFLGVGILKVKGLFRRLRKLALRHGGVVVFFDEADSLGSRGNLNAGGWNGQRSGNATGRSFGAVDPSCHGISYVDELTQRLTMAAGASDEEDAPRRRRAGVFMGMGGDTGTLQALLTELSGLSKPRGFFNRTVRKLFGMQPKPPPKYRILVMMATNMPGALDEALLRPGRLDRMYKVGYPSKAGRVRTYEGYFSKVTHDLTAEQMDKLANITPYATGATIKDLVNEALINAIRNEREVVTWEDVTYARRLKALGPPEGVEYIDRERHATALHEACHAVAAYRRQDHLTIDMATIEKGANYLGMVSSIKPEDIFSEWRSEFENDIIVFLASLAGERMFFEGDHSSGVRGDLNAATRIAAYMEAYWGMGKTVASHGALSELGIASGGGSPGSPDGSNASGEARAPSMAEMLGPRIESKLADLLAQTEELLQANRMSILAVTHALETYKTISGDDVEAIIEGHRGPLVDGAIYHHPAFLEAAEEYHSRAVRAQKAHENIPVLMPVLGSWSPEEESHGD